MEFIDNIPIYLQVKEFIEDNILKGKWKSKDKIPSIRQVSSDFEINPHTAINAYNILQDKSIIEKKRGIGFFVSKEAKEIILKYKREEFIKNKIPKFLEQMKLLDIPFELLEK